MGRAVSRDRLADDVAQKVREAARSARKLKGLRNGDIAEFLGWAERRVVDTLASRKPLRAGNARALVAALLEMRPGKAEATAVLLEAWKLVGPSVNRPAVLIPAWEFDHLAEHFANELSRVAGTRAKHREKFKREVRYVIGRTAANMAASFYSACSDRFENDRTAGEVLIRFGWNPIVEKERKK